MGFFAIIAGLILTFLLVVIVHELGHFFAARLVGVKPEIFSVGFGRPIWSRMDRHGTCWQIAAIPAGGFVRFVGDENAASMATGVDGPILPGSLRAASKMRQAVVVLAGPFANIILTVALLSATSMMQGVTAYPWSVAHVAVSEPQSGLRAGDVILSVGEAPITPDTAPAAVWAAQTDDAALSYLVSRDGTESRVSGLRPDAALIGFVAPDSPADQAGLLVGDLIASIDGEAIVDWPTLQGVVASSNGNPLRLSLLRGDQRVAVELNPKASGGGWQIGVGAAPVFTLARETPGLLTGLSIGFDRSVSLLGTTVAGLSSSLVGRGDPCALDGPVEISRVAGQALLLGPEVFLTFLAVISLGLGLLNLLPIPILDGGHLLMLGYAGVTGRELPKRARAVLFILGVTVIAYLMLTATLNDLMCG